MESQISLKNLGKSFGNKRIFSNLNLEIPAGEITVLVGPNGCGKSTLLQILSGLLSADEGEYFIRKFNPLSFSYLMQNYRSTLMPWLTNQENILLPLRLQKKQTATIKQKENIIQQNVSGFNPDEYPYELSGGQQQMIALWRAMISEPDLLFVDESFSALDPQNAQLFRKTIADYQLKHKATILMVSHDVTEIMLLSHNIIFFSARPAEVIARIKNNLPWPRFSEGLNSSEANELRRKIFEALDFKI